MEHTQRLAEFVVDTSYGQLPAAAVAAAKMAIIDSVGVALAGSREEASAIVASMMREGSAEGACAVFGHGFRGPAAAAAMANGVAGHALDFDASFTIMGQPMAGLVPAAFAMAEAVGASGAALLEAYLIGFELTAKLARCAPSHANEGGWHSTGTLGSLGSAAVAAKLLGLGVVDTRTALGIAASMASGLVANFGTMTKPLHAGLAARNGVLAARLAQRGFSANMSIFDDSGYFASFARGAECDMTPLDGLGRNYEVVDGVRFKAYPCGGLAHTAIDAALALRGEESLTAADVDTVEADVTQYTAMRIVFGIPHTELQAKFSMPYLLARSILDGRLVPETFSDNAIHEPAALALAARVRMEVDPNLRGGVGVSQPSTVRIRTRDGRTLSRHVDHARGTPQVPMSPQELIEKFSMCAQRVLGDQALLRTRESLENLESVERISQIGGLLLGEESQATSDS